MTRILALLITTALLSCGGDSIPATSTTNIQEPAQQLGDVMASIDEMGGSDGDPTVSFRFSRMQNFTPNAVMANCSDSSTFSACAANTITRTFSSCSISDYTLDGTVTLTWSDAASDTTCAATATGHSITRVPNFSITGGRGGTLNVSKTGAIGQRLTRTLTGFTFTNDGINREVTINSVPVYDHTTSTTGALIITGFARSGRVLSSSGGAAIRVTDNISGVTCDYVPTAVTWANNCTCPTSGSWTATCSDGKTSTYTIRSCRWGDFTMGDNSQTVYLDRCYSL